MINVRQAMAAAWRQPVPDQLWDYLLEKGYVGEVEEGRMPVGDLIEEAQQIRAAARSASSDDNDIARQAAGAAASARIDALSAIYAAWARQDLEVCRFRSHPLLASGLLAPDEVGPLGHAILDRYGFGDASSLAERVVFFTQPDDRGWVHLLPVQRRVSYTRGSAAAAWLHPVGAITDDEECPCGSAGPYSACHGRKITSGDPSAAS